MANSGASRGPLAGYKIIEIAGIGPGPFAAMMLSDMGAEVVRVERVQAVRDTPSSGAHWDVMLRGRKNIAIDLKQWFCTGCRRLLVIRRCFAFSPPRRVIQSK